MISEERVGVVVNQCGVKWKPRPSIAVCTAILLAMIVGALGCRPKFGGAGSFPAASTANCLPDITLVDQNGRAVSLASLKGRPVLVDFIYTECPGPCLMLTSKMVNTAKLLRAQMGTQVQLLSISIDPAHDTPAALSRYAKAQGANMKGWLFLTGSPQQIDDVLARYNLRRAVQSNGLIDHVVEFFLLGPNGQQLRQYAATEVTPDTLAADVRVAIARG